MAFNRVEWKKTIHVADPT